MTNNEKSRLTKQAVQSPGLNEVLETALYVDDLERAEGFYAGVLGLTKILSVPGRQLTFRCGEGVLLIFNPDQTAQGRIVINGGTIPFHGAHGPGHMAFRVRRSQLDEWRQYFQTVGVAIESEISWPNGAHSIYFRDPAGNSLELATPDMWVNLVL
jgi:catechol 2,3-dioxygenase-like lactoylglutathione lyase family enzyme